MFSDKKNKFNLQPGMKGRRGIFIFFL